MKAFQIRFTDEEYDELVSRASGQKLATYVRDCVFGSVVQKRYVEPIEVVPIATTEAYGQAAIKPVVTPIADKPALNSINPKIVELQKQIVAMEKKPVKRGAVTGSGYVPKKRGVEMNERGEYEEAVIDVNSW
jgi:hypothetical protein